MACTKYLEIDSTYRNRNQYPLPSNFIVDISQSGRGDKLSARDPVSYASPIHYWNNSFLEDAASYTTATSGNISVDNSYSPSDLSTLKITLAGGDSFRQVYDFYVGAVFDVTNGGVANVRRRITSYERINATTAIIKVDKAFDSSSFGTDGFIQNPTPLATDTASSTIKMFIPAGSDIDNYYVNYYIQLVNSPGGLTPEAIKIVNYDGTLRLATLESATTDDWADTGTQATANSNFAIRKQIPTSNGDLLGVSSNGMVVQLALASSSVTSDYVGSFLRMVEPVPTTSGFSSPDEPYGEEKRIVKYIAASGTFVNTYGSGTNTFILDNTASNVDDYYLNSFITTAGGITKQIASYVGSTRSGTISGTWGGSGIASGEGWTIRTAFLSGPFSTDPGTGSTVNQYELEQFSYDNWNPFDYTGSLVSSQNPVCYEIQLENLVLPNEILTTGSKIAFYPYVYVELRSVTSSSQNSIIYSNNPNSKKMMFRATVDDVSDQETTSFIKINGDDQKQTVKFKPNDSFRFSVKLPNGTYFTTEDVDKVSPTEPDPLLQISALFSLKPV